MTTQTRAAAFLAIALVVAQSAAWATDDLALKERGSEVYATYCSGCHGDSGDGKGPAAAVRDLKLGSLPGRPIAP